jgi:protein involved in polysaccharide export with SLBB domain
MHLRRIRIRRRRITGFIFIFLVACGLCFFSLIATGCGPLIKNPTPLEYTEGQPPPQAIEEYRIQPGDQLDIKFFYNPELNELLIPVRPDGRISLQLAGEIRAAGMTPAELTRALEEKYAVELKKPEVTVIVRTFSGRLVFVDGEVGRAGLVNLVGPMTILQSLSQTGGFRATARRNEVILIRRDANHRPTIHTVNLEKALDGTDMSQDAFLQPFDIVYVPRSPIANAALWVDQYIRRMVPFSVGAGYTGESGISVTGAMGAGGYFYSY